MSTVEIPTTLVDPNHTETPPETPAGPPPSDAKETEHTALQVATSEATLVTDPATIVATIRLLQERGQRSALDMFICLLDIGVELAALKEATEHGDWLNCLKDLEYNETKAQRFKRLAASPLATQIRTNGPDLLPYLPTDLQKLDILAKLDEAQLNQLWKKQGRYIPGMSREELRDAVKALFGNKPAQEPQAKPDKNSDEAVEKTPEDKTAPKPNGEELDQDEAAAEHDDNQPPAEPGERLPITPPSVADGSADTKSVPAPQQTTPSLPATPDIHIPKATSPSELPAPLPPSPLASSSESQLASSSSRVPAPTSVGPAADRATIAPGLSDAQAAKMLAARQGLEALVTTVRSALDACGLYRNLIGSYLILEEQLKRFAEGTAFKRARSSKPAVKPDGQAPVLPNPLSSGKSSEAAKGVDGHADQGNTNPASGGTVSNPAQALAAEPNATPSTNTGPASGTDTGELGSDSDETMAASPADSKAQSAEATSTKAVTEAPSEPTAADSVVSMAGASDKIVALGSNSTVTLVPDEAVEAAATETTEGESITATESIAAESSEATDDAAADLESGTETIACEF